MCTIIVVLTFFFFTVCDFAICCLGFDAWHALAFGIYPLASGVFMGFYPLDGSYARRG